MKCSIPSNKSKPTSPIFNHHFGMANCSTVQKKRGLKPHPCRTPPVMLNFFLLRPDDPMTCPYCPSYVCEIIEVMCCELPCSRKLSHKVLANGFDKSTLTTHTGVPTAKVLPRKALAVKRCSSMGFPGRNLCCSTGWWSSS